MKLNSNDNKEIISVSEALRKNEGKWKIQGNITSMSKIYKLISEIKIYCKKCNIDTDIKPEFPTHMIDNEDLLCSKCNKKTTKIIDRFYSTAINIELQDSETFNDIDRLVVILFDKDTENILVGERVVVNAEINIASGHGRYGKLFPYYYAESLKYEDRKDTKLNEEDIKNIRSYVSKIGEDKIIEKLSDIFAPSIIGFRNVKKGILLSAVNTGIKKNKTENSVLIKRDRINVLLVGDPGLAKSNFIRSAVKLVENSRYESGENSSGKSLTAIVSKEDDNYVLRSGPLVLTRYAIAGINEFSNIKLEEQNHFLSIMEEGEFSINKHGINAKISAPTTVIASANPVYSKWKNRDKIDINEIPIKKTILDRFDLIFVFVQPNDPKDIAKYAYEKSRIEEKRIPENPFFLIKYIAYAKSLNPRFTPEAKIMLDQFFVDITSSGISSYRGRETLYRISKAMARLKLKNLVEAGDATEAMEFYNGVLKQFKQVVDISPDPRIVAVDECINILSNLNCGIAFEDLILKVCKVNEHVKQYLGFNGMKINLHMKDNKKIRNVYELLLNHSNIKRVQEKPVVLKWFSESNSDTGINYKNQDEKIESPKDHENKCANDQYDRYDRCDQGKNNDEIKDYNNEKHDTLLKNNYHEINSDHNQEKKSYGSHESDNILNLIDDNINKLQNDNNSLVLEFRCYYCPKTFSSETEYLSHSLNIHPGKIVKPDKKMLILLNLQPKGNCWEFD